MKVTIQIIDSQTEEYADLYVHEQDAAIKNLEEYLSLDAYRNVSIPCTFKDEKYQVPARVIYWIETVGEKQMVHTGDVVYETKKRLYELEALLPKNFVRISKSVILNIEKASSYKPLLNGLMQVNLTNSDITYISRKYLKEVRNRIMEVQYETETL